jgi:hypothetical protein
VNTNFEHMGLNIGPCLNSIATYSLNRFSWKICILNTLFGGVYGDLSKNLLYAD